MNRQPSMAETIPDMLSTKCKVEGYRQRLLMMQFGMEIPVPIKSFPTLVRNIQVRMGALW